MAGTLIEILQAANKHPNSRVSKLIHTVEEEPNQKNIVLLLIELADHAEYSVDFNVSLKYYLDLFERLGIGKELVLNEAGLLLVNTSKIYSKRVDYVHSLVERQILTLLNADDELQKQKLAEQQKENAPSAEKPKRGRKRALDTPSDPYEIELVPKKIKRLTEEKRFSAPKAICKTKLSRNVEMEQQIHPAGWQNATIYDFENEEDVDTKRNYKLFTYHVEHRYNTLVPDINFRLHFKVKDYMDEQEEMEEDEACNTGRIWPPLSEAYVQKYLRLENYVLQTDVEPNKRKKVEEVIGTQDINEKLTGNKVANSDSLDESQKLNSSSTNIISVSSDHDNQSELLQSSLSGSIANSSSNDSGLGQSILDETNHTLGNTQLNSSLESSIVVEQSSDRTSLEPNESPNTTDSQTEVKNLLAPNDLEHPGSTGLVTENKENEITTNDISLNATETQPEYDSVLDTSKLETTGYTENNTTIESTQISESNTASEKKLNIDVEPKTQKDAVQINPQLPCADDEGVCLSDLEDNDCRLLCPVIKATNILPGVERKDVTIIMDDELRQALDMRDGILEHFSHETYKVPVITQERKHKLVFNILNLPEKLLRRKVLFKLGPEMDLYLKARSLKRCKPEPIVRITRNTELMQLFALNNTDMTGIYMTPPNSPGHSPAFCGFSDSEDDSRSCLGFHGFTEEEQSTIMVKNICRLSRDSGVGVDVNNLTPEKETGEPIFQNGNKNIDSDTTENILSQLSSEIRNLLTTELQENGENISTTTTTTGTCTSLNTTPETQESNNDISNNNVISESLCTENDKEKNETVITENALSSNTQKSDSANQSHTVIPNPRKTKNSNDTFKSKDVEISLDEPLNTEVLNGNNKELSKEKLDIANGTDHMDDHCFDVAGQTFEDDVILDFDNEGSKTKIQQWHEQLQPILAKSRERHHFDVYNLGTDIIETVQNKDRTSTDAPMSKTKSNYSTSSNAVASFHEIMENKDKSCVSRYFLSTLLLANQSNIEISLNNKSTEEPSSWHDINLKLISTKRHTVAIEDNIGMINKKQNPTDNHVMKNSKEKADEATVEEDKPIRKLQSVKNPSKNHKKSLKRVNASATNSYSNEKKPKEIIYSTCPTNDRPSAMPNLIQNVQIVTPPFVKPLPADHISIIPSTSQQANQINNPLFNVCINSIQTLKPIEKVQKRNDDHDSGIFSIDEMSTS